MLARPSTRSPRTGGAGARPRARTGRRVAGTLLAALMVITACEPQPSTRPQHSRIDLQVLVVDDASPQVRAIVDRLDAEGVPHTDVVLSEATRPQITAGFLASGSHAFYQAVVLPSAADGGLSAAEHEAIDDFAAAFDIRVVIAYTYAHAAVGLDRAGPLYEGNLDGVTSTVTPAGKADGFGQLVGPVPFGPGSYASVAHPIPVDQLPPGNEFTTLVAAPIPGSATPGSIIGVYRSGGHERLIITAAFEKSFSQFRALGHGIVTWMTRGVHLGHDRNYFSVQIDDVFNSDALWDGDHKCTPGEDCPRDENGQSIYPETYARMTAEDAATLAAFQRDHDFQFQLAYNAGLAEPGDPLTETLLADKGEYWWVNHTFDHEFLGCVQDFTVIPWRCSTDPDTGQMLWQPESLIVEQIQSNLEWAAAHQVPSDPTELVSGEYSGLQIPGVQPGDSPEFLDAITATGIRWLASDVSRNEYRSRVVAGATTTPRYPVNIFYNVATAAQEVSEYNWLYTSVADGGSGYCTDHPETTTCIEPLDESTGFTDYIVPLETEMRMADILHNDPRSVMTHATNFTGEHLALQLVAEILNSYRSLMTPATPLVVPRPSQVGTILTRQQNWETAATGVTAYLEHGTVHVEGPAGTEVPLTVPAGTAVTGGGLFGETYGGERSAWVTLETAPLTLTVPSGTAANPTPPSIPGAVTVTAATPGTVRVGWGGSVASGGRATDVVVLLELGSGPSRLQAVDAGADSVTFTGLEPDAVPDRATVYAANSLGLVLATGPGTAGP